VTWVHFADNKGGRWGKWEEQGDKEERHVGKAKSCLRFEGIVASGSGNSGAVMWSEMADSEATVCACLTEVCIKAAQRADLKLEHTSRG